jgi:glycosyltransferase involved in cell wall biosynthesis
LRVLFPFVGDSIGGSHRSILELYAALKADSSITPIFVLHKIGVLSELFDTLNIKYEYIYVKHLAGNSASILKITFSVILNFFKLSKFIRKNRIDIVHGNDLRVNLTWSLPTRLSGSIYLWHQRSLMSCSVLWRVSVVLADHFLTISEYVHQSLPNNILKSKKTLVLNPFNTEIFYEREKSKKWLNALYSIPENTILLGYIGRLVDWKNVDFLINCFAKYVKNNSFHLHLIIVGTGDSEYVDSLKRLVQKLKVNNIITFSGFNSEPNRIISAFDLMVAPSNQEPFGRTLVEAMIQKTPILAARGGGHSEIIDHGVTGRLYNHNDINDFIKQSNRCLGSDKSEPCMTNKANTVALSLYSSQRHSKNIIRIYQKLLSR